MTEPETFQCDICCEVTSEPLVQPCSQCPASYCTDCITKMFTKAIHERSSMPPQCCTILPLHIGLPHLSEEDAEAYRQKFNEIVMSKEGFYCPNAACSRFISGVAIDEAKGTSSTTDTPAKSPVSTASKHDSVHSNLITPAEVRCPSCGVSACVSCRAPAHAGSSCEQFSGDVELERQLTAWGYKRCPGCRNAIRRMYGCSHMQCGWCTMHFCWYCLKNVTHCETEGCDGYNDDGDGTDGYTDDEEEGHNEIEHSGPVEQAASGIESITVDPSGSDTNAAQQTTAGGASIPGSWDDDHMAMHATDPTTHEGDAVHQQLASSELAATSTASTRPRVNVLLRFRRLCHRLRDSLYEDAGPEARVESPAPIQVDQETAPDAGNDEMDIAEPAQPALEVAANIETDTQAESSQPAPPTLAVPSANLDGRSPGHWMDSGLDFGEEPGDSRTTVGSCSHTFVLQKVAITPTMPWKEMQCHRCWKTIHPKILKFKFPLKACDRGLFMDPPEDDDEVENKADTTEEKNVAAGSALGQKSGMLKAMNCRWCGFLACPHCVERMKPTANDP